MLADWFKYLSCGVWLQIQSTFCTNGGVYTSLNRPREAPYVWCPRKSQNLPSNPQARKPQIRKFGQRLSCDFQKRKYFGFLLLFHSFRFLCSLATRIMSLKSDKIVWISNFTMNCILRISGFLIEWSTSISPQIRKKVDKGSKFRPSNPQKRDRDLTIFRPQIRKIEARTSFWSINPRQLP